MDSFVTVPMDTGYHQVVNDICALKWAQMGREEITLAAWAYYYFSIQFRENLEIAHDLHPHDTLLPMLVREECDTDNLSPWPGVVVAGEKVNHDEFMRRALELSPVAPTAQRRVQAIGLAYLASMRAQDPLARAKSIASFEDGGLERVFNAILTCECWDTSLLAAFKHFLVQHIKFDGDPTDGHGALARHLQPDERIFPIWHGFYRLMVDAVPQLKE